MSIETLVRQGSDRVHSGLAAVDSSRLRQMRSEALRSCFSRFDESSYRMEYVARIHGKEFVNDAAARSINATWYTLENTEGSIIWIANGGNNRVDYSPLRSVALRKVRMLLCVGDDNRHLHESFKGIIPNIVDAESIGAAVHKACYSNLDRSKVVYSPATDGFLTTEQAGEVFRHEVNEL